MSNIINILARMRARNVFPDCFLDVGAHFGETHNAIKHVYPSSRVFCFEGNPYCESVLQSKNINYSICLLGKEYKEKIPFYINPNDVTSTGSSIYQEVGPHFETGKTIEVSMFRLDEKVTANNNGNIFLKLDVQGAELDILDGATKLLPNLKWIYLEVSFVECNKGAPLFPEVYDYLIKRNYKIVDFEENTYVDNVLLQSNFLFEKID